MPTDTINIQSTLYPEVTIRLKAFDMEAYQDFLKSAAALQEQEEQLLKRVRQAESDKAAIFADPSSTSADRLLATSRLEQSKQELSSFTVLDAGPLLIRCGLEGFEGLLIDGHLATPHDLLEGNCPDGLWTEVIDAIHSQIKPLKEVVASQSSSLIN